jgi:hypothetical protein
MAVLASFHERYERLMADSPDVKKDIDLVHASIVQRGQLVQNSPKVNGNEAQWKQPADRAEYDRYTLCQSLDSQALFTGLVHMYAVTYKEMRDGLKAWNRDKKQNKANAERKKEALQEETEEITSSLPKPTAGSNESLRDLSMENAEMGSERNSTKTLGTDENPGKIGHLPSY